MSISAGDSVVYSLDGSARLVDPLSHTSACGRATGQCDCGAQRFAPAEESVDAYKNMLGQLWLYVDWRYVTKQLEAEHKERWARAVEQWSAAVNPGDPDPVHVDRWWLCPTCGVSIRAKLEDGPHEHCVFADD